MLPIHFAPIQGYTDFAYRNIHSEIFGGIETYYTPFMRIEHGEVRKKDFKDVLPENNCVDNLVPQVIVKDVDELKCLVKPLVEMGYKHIDINMGCPFPMQTRKGRGAGLMPNAEMVEAIMIEMKSMTDVKFSVKMRLGNESPEECLKLLPIINKEQPEYVTMHPRVATQQYKGDLNMSAFETFYENCEVPVFFNGEITSVKEINQIEERFPKLKGVMIGRGLLMRPSLAVEYKMQREYSEEELLSSVLRFHDKILEHCSNVLQGDGHLLVKMKTFWEYLENVIGRKNYKNIKKSVTMAKYKAHILAI